jgi:sulfate adenylyltransferase subunit 2
MYDFRDRIASEPDINLLVYINDEGIKKNINPIDHGPELHTRIMKTDALKNAMSKYQFDMALAGARRDEEKSRAKERIFSFRSKHQKWDPRSQRPELWNLRNTRKNKGESFRVFPISNWTELDIWLYIFKEKIPIVPLYFSKARRVISRDDVLIMVDDERLRVRDGEKIHSLPVRFRTLGCYPLTGAIQSSACSVEEVIKEAKASRLSERAGRVIDHGFGNSMERKKLDGYF